MSSYLFSHRRGRGGGKGPTVEKRKKPLSFSLCASRKKEKKGLIATKGVRITAEKKEKRMLQEKKNPRSEEKENLEEARVHGRVLRLEEVELYSSEEGGVRRLLLL